MSEDQQTNGIDPTVAKRWVGEIEARFAELESERGEYMNRCKSIREDIKACKEAAASAGLPKRGLNHLLKRREIEKTLRKHEDTEPDIVETADMIDDALGGDKGLAGSPLGAAAGGSPDDDKDLRGKRQKDREAQRQADAQTNLAGMKADTAEKARASRKKRSAALDDLAGTQPEGTA